MLDRTALAKLTYGMYIITSRNGEKSNGQLANTIFQISSEPPIIAACINKTNVTHGLVQISGRFNVSVLSVSTPLKMISDFGFKHGTELDKLSGVATKDGEQRRTVGARSHRGHHGNRADR